MLLRVFECTTPLSKYLQTKNLDILKSHQMALSTIDQLKNISRDFDDVKQKSLTFVDFVNKKFDEKDAPDELMVTSELQPSPSRKGNISNTLT